MQVLITIKVGLVILAPNKETLVPITLLGTSLSNNVTIGVSSVNGDVDARNTNNADSFSYEF